LKNKQEPAGLNMICCGKSILAIFPDLNSLNMLNIRLTESKNMTQNGFPSRRSTKPDWPLTMQKKGEMDVY